MRAAGAVRLYCVFGGETGGCFSRAVRRGVSVLRLCRALPLMHFALVRISVHQPIESTRRLDYLEATDNGRRPVSHMAQLVTAPRPQRPTGTGTRVGGGRRYRPAPAFLQREASTDKPWVPKLVATRRRLSENGSRIFVKFLSVCFEHCPQPGFRRAALLSLFLSQISLCTSTLNLQLAQDWFLASVCHSLPHAHGSLTRRSS